jgi:hypothetical protein
MAHTAKTLHTAETDAAKLVSKEGTGDSVTAAHAERSSPTRSAIPRALQDGIRRATHVVTDAKQSVGHTFRTARDRATDAYSDLSYNSRYLSRHLRDRATQLKEERPLPLLAVIAASAFVVGIFVRVWRSRRYEH